MRLFALLAILFASVGLHAQPSESPPASGLSEIVMHYIAAQEAVMEIGAGATEVQTLMDFYAEDYVYHHPQFGARVTGIAQIRRAIMAHLGESADANIEVRGLLVHGSTVIVAVDESFRNVADGQIVRRSRTIVLTFRGRRIAQRIDI